MHEMAEFFAHCAQSGALLASLCALFIIPPAAWLACRAVAIAIIRMHDDPAWQAPLAAAAAGLPGATLVALATTALLRGAGAACLALPTGRLIFGLIIAATTAAIVRAIWLSYTRARGMRRLVAQSRSPCARLREIAASCGLAARETSAEAPVCALAGTMSPVVLVSRGALRLLDDDELRAALHHERAHARRGDHVIAACLYFLVDLLPLPSADMLQTYKQAREFAADRVAAGLTGVDALAGALIHFANSRHAVAATVSFAGAQHASVTERIRALLEVPHCREKNRILPRIAVALALAVIALAGLAAPVIAAQQPVACALSMSEKP